MITAFRQIRSGSLSPIHRRRVTWDSLRLVTLVTTLSTAMVMLLPMPGCATGSTTSADESGLPTSIARLRSLALKEQSRPASNTVIDQTPLPPGIAAEEIAPIETDDFTAASESLESVVHRLAVIVTTPNDEPEDVDVSDADRLAALHAYVQGRGRRLDGAHDAAELHLKESARLDPGAAAPWRELGELNLAIGNRPAAIASFRRAVDRDPDDLIALYHLSEQALDRREFEEAAALLCRLWLQPLESYDPALPYIVAGRLGTALLEIGAVRAGRDALLQAAELPARFDQSTLFSNSLNELFRRRGDIWRNIGDASLRLQELDQADQAYQQALELPNLNPGALLPRRIYAALCQQRPATAVNFMIDEIIAMGGQIDGQLISLLQYLAANNRAGALLDAALPDVPQLLEPAQRRRADSNLTLARAATASPDEAMQILRDHLQDSPADAAVVEALFERLADVDRSLLVQETIDRIERSPIHAPRYAEALFRVEPEIPALLQLWSDTAAASRTTNAGRLFHALLLIQAGRPLDADAVLSELLQQDPDFPPAIVARMDLLVQLGRTIEADSLLDRLDENQSPELRMAKTRALARRGDAAAALALLEPMLAGAEAGQVPDIEAMLLGARLEQQLGRPERAEGLYQKAMQADPTRDEPYMGLLTLYNANGALASDQKLIETIRALRAANPSSRMLRIIRAQELLARQQFDLAERDLLELAEQYPRQEEIVSLLMRVWLETDSLGRATDWLSQNADRYPGEGFYDLYLGQVLDADGKPQQAAEILERTLERLPGEDRVSRLLERIYRLELDRVGRADELAVIRLSRAPRTLDTLIELAAIRLNQRRLDDAVPLVNEIIQRQDNLREEQQQTFNQMLLQLYAQASQGRLPARQSLALLHEAVSRFEKASPQVHLMLIRLMQAALEPHEAIAATADLGARRYPEFRAGFYIEPMRVVDTASNSLLELEKDPDKTSSIPNVDKRARRAETALHVIEYAVLKQQVIEPSTLAAWLIVARQLTEMNSLDQALRSMQDANLTRQTVTIVARSFGIEEDEASLCNTLAAFATDLWDDGRIARAEEIYELALTIDPQNPDVCNNFGYRLLEEDRRIDRAVELIETAYRQSSEFAHIIDSMGWARYKQGILEDVTDADGRVVTQGAVSLLKEAVRTALLSNDEANAYAMPVLRDHLGDALWAAGRREEAIAAWTEARKDADQVRQALGRTNLPGALAILEEIRAVQRNVPLKLEAAREDRNPPISLIHAPVENSKSPAGAAKIIPPSEGS